MDWLATFWHRRMRAVRGSGRGSKRGAQSAPPPDHSSDLPEETHHVYCNQPHLDTRYRYHGNRVRTTKYTWYSFLPKSLFEQYRRVAYWYFTAMAALSFSPFSPYTGVSVISPLAFVLLLGMGRELWEDWRRAKGDREVNSRPVEVYSADGKMVTKVWRDIKVGDVVRIEDKQYFPADLLVLSSSLPQGSCYVETKNLDGETNLKVRQALDCTADLREVADLQRFSAHLKCDAPNASLYTFTGLMELSDGQSYSVGPQQILLRDSTLQNTGHVFGVVIYTGHDTKVLQNATPPPSKRSRIDRTLDKVIWAMIAILFFLSFVTGLVFSLITRKYGPDMFYLQPGISDPYYNPNRAAVAGIVSFVTNLVLYGYLVPIALYVTLEIVRVLQAAFIMPDLHMYDEETGKPARVKSSGLNEELGQVDTILSDKTGTLTRNQMDFFRCTIAGVSYGRGITEVERTAKQLGLHVGGNESSDIETPEFQSSSVFSQTNGEPPSSDGFSRYTNPEDDSSIPYFGTKPSSVEVDHLSTAENKRIKGFNFQDSRLLGGNWVNEEHPDIIQFFFEILALCHTAIPEGDVEDLSCIEYRAESPDEAALVVAAKQFGFCFHKRTSTAVHVKEVSTPSKEDKKYDLLNILEFSSARKRMSVIVRFPDGRLLLLSKGADSVMLQRLNPSNKGYANQTMDHLREFGEVGLRTLVVAYKELDEDEYQRWDASYVAAKAVVGREREARIEEVEDKIEKGLTVIGGTGVEDKLQVGVPETIDRLAQAGIKIWVLTGDKVETAINIGYACSLLRKGMEKIIVTLDTAEVRDLEDSIQQDGLSRDEATQQMKDIVARQLTEGLEALERSKTEAVSKRAIGKRSGRFSLRQNSVRQGSFRRSMSFNTRRQLDVVEGQEMEQIEQGKPLSEQVTTSDESIQTSYALVIDGQCLAFVLGEQRLQGTFLQLCLQCASVLCCRVSPRQKAQVAILVRKGLGESRLCLAIGDGANDVGMIQAANVGVGIAGVEGAQAAMAADYSIGQFRFLQRLLLVHGHWCYRRISFVILFFFYKVCLMGWIAFYCNLFNFMSGEPLYNSWYAALYNTVFTSLPIGVVGVIDQDVEADSLLEHPELYQSGQRKAYFNRRLLVGYIINSIWGSLIIFFFPLLLLWANPFRKGGQVADAQDFGAIMFTGVVLVPNIQLAVNINYVTVFHHVALWGSIVVFFLVLLVYGALQPLLATTAYRELVEVMAPSASYWLLHLSVVVTALWPSFALRTITACFFPSPIQIVREKKYLGKK